MVVTQPLPRPPPPTVVVLGIFTPLMSLNLLPGPHLPLLQATLPGGEEASHAWLVFFLENVLHLVHYNGRSNPVEEIGFLDVCVNPK